MAQRRMFSLVITDTDAFLEMPVSSQALYFHLGMHADDDGFVASPKMIMRAAGCSNDDLERLATKGFIIPFTSGVVLLRDWHLNNTIKNDRYHATVYLAEKAMVTVDKDGRYLLGSKLEPEALQHGSKLEPEHSLVQYNIEELSERRADKPPRARFVPPTLEEVKAYCAERHSPVDPEHFFAYFEAGDWKDAKGQAVKSWKQKLLTWENRERNDTKHTEPDIRNPDRYHYEEGESL